MLEKILNNTSIQKEIQAGLVRFAKKAWWLALIVVAGLWLVGQYNLFALPQVVLDTLGIERQNSSQVEGIVAGKLESTALLAEATREYTGNAVFEREGGVLNCAGEEQQIKNGRATARATVAANGIRFVDTDDSSIEITLPSAQLADVNLDEELEIVNKRNPCVRLVQVFGDTTNENQVRTLLKDEVTEIAKQDTALLMEAECTAITEIRSLLESVNVNTDAISIRTAQANQASCS